MKDKLLKLKKMIEDSNVDQEYKDACLPIVESAIQRGYIEDDEKKKLVEILGNSEETAKFMQSVYNDAADRYGALADNVSQAWSDTSKSVGRAVEDSDQDLSDIEEDVKK